MKDKLSRESMKLRNFAATASKEEAIELFESTVLGLAVDPKRAAHLLGEAMCAFAMLLTEYSVATGRCSPALYHLPDDLKMLYGLACVALAKSSGRGMQFNVAYLDEDLRARKVDEVP